MRLINILRNVSFYRLDLSGIFYLQDGYLYFNETLVEKINPNMEDSNIMDMSFYEKGLSIHFNNGANWLLFSEKKKIKISYNSLSSNITQNKISVYDYDYDLLTPLNNVYDIKQNSLSFTEWKKGRCYILSPNIYIYIYQKDVSFIDLNNSKTFNFSVKDFPTYLNGFYREQEADIKQIIGVYNDILWVHVGGFRLVGIDVETGKQVHYIEDIPYHLGLTKEERRHFDFSSWGNSIHLDEKTGILKSFAHRYYMEIDLNTLQGRVKKDLGENWKTSWQIKNSTYYQEYPDLLFFSGFYKNMDKQPNGFGIFNTEKAEIIWYDTTKDNLGYFYNPPQANDKLLAILDDKHNLLVYERK